MDKFIALTPEINSYVAAHHTKSSHSELIRELRTETEALGDIAVMLISEEQGAFLSLLVGIIGAKYAVEVGTFTGYSALHIGEALPDGGKLWCFDQSEEWTSIGRRYWKRAGLDGKISLTLGDAKEVLRDWQPEQPIDIAFIDADKPGYETYFEILFPHLRPNGLFIFDNMLRGGSVTNPVSDDDKVIDALNKKLVADPRLETVLLPIADGILLCRKKPEAV